jgi:CRP/FNR family transcriptional regulator, cyclic AMP receptor protein
MRPAAQPAPAAPALQPGTSRRSVALLDVDPELGDGMTPERFAIARHEIRAVPLLLRRGEWSPGEAGSLNCSQVGLLVLDGVLARELLLEDMVSTELLGPGDFIRPWTDEEPSLLRQRVRWQVLAEARVAVLGRSFTKALHRYPELSEALTDRALARSQRLATTQAISHLNSVERRVCALLWHLAERWGRVTGDGIVVPLTLSHRLLGELIGARRPTVSTALAALDRQGKVRRREDATWLLTGEPPGTPSAQVPRLISHRRRLVSRQTGPALSVVDGSRGQPVTRLGPDHRALTERPRRLADDARGP